MADREFQLGPALALSLLLHAALLLLAPFVPVTGATPVRALQPEETTITFVLGKPSEMEKQEGVARGVPIDEPDLPARAALPSLDPDTPPPQEQATAPDDPPEGATFVDPEPQADPLTVPEAVPPPRPTQEEFEPIQEGGAEDREASPEAGATLPESAGGEYRAGPPAASGRGTAEEQTSLRESLRDFGDALARAARSSPVPPREPRREFHWTPPDVAVAGQTWGELEFESGDFDWSEYRRQLLAALQRTWYRVLNDTVGDFEHWARNNRPALDDWTRFRFTIGRDGDVSQIALEDASSCQPLDASARQALQNVILPPLPSAFPRDQETVRMRFIARVDIWIKLRVDSPDGGGPRIRTFQPMREYLRALQLAGYF